MAGFDSLDKGSNILAHMPGKFVTGNQVILRRFLLVENVLGSSPL